ncbi:MAG TPA: prolyl oligopeptidase family serine peptidase [Candidatus Woesebacteria bacterium]|nr:prolyl oligopeptidase family serine peptidase [Candidatus Woesebacteria bacterium]HPJ17270.1 prolyl oligopeptidase family serine peptidase [Candidatus Woesebacteria bacterium]
MKKLKGLILITVLMVVLGGCGIKDPKGNVKEIISHNLEKYDFDSLSKRQGEASEIKITQEKAKYGSGVVYSFTSQGKKISGTMVDLHPEMSKLRPAIVMIRGYAPTEGYYPGSGSWRVAEELAKEGYVTFSIDFLGYGQSDSGSADALEARFEKVINVMDLIESIKKLPWIDQNKIGIWAHSNGGQITLSVLEVTGGNYPTVLWAPMTNPFPQSLIDTADEGEEKQKAIEYVNLFLKYYDGRRYAVENYWEKIKAPILIQQGTADEWCEVEWQEKVVKSLKDLGKKAELVIYRGSDHNLKKDWSEAVRKDLEWFKKYW